MLAKMSGYLEKFQGLALLLGAVGIILSSMFWMYGQQMEQIATLRQDIQNVETALRQEMQSMESDLRAELIAVRAEMQALRAEMQALRSEQQAVEIALRQEIRGSEADLRTELRNVEADLQRQIDGLQRQIDGLQGQINELDKGQAELLFEIGKIQGAQGVARADTGDDAAGN